ncbi:MAG: SRPBCC family protein [Anaerolineae bacterium]|nr:SRPBCC family protein [Anaerolineae bacterium]
MLVVEQTTVIEAPIDVVMQALNDVKTFPTWTTVQGKIDHVQGSGPGMTYEWHYTVEGLNFNGQSEVLEQTADTLITKTTGDIDSIWTITLAPVGKKNVAMRVVVEYTPPHAFVEVLADKIIQQYTTPAVASENLRRFKQSVEERVKMVGVQV